MALSSMSHRVCIADRIILADPDGLLSSGDTRRRQSCGRTLLGEPSKPLGLRMSSGRSRASNLLIDLHLLVYTQDSRQEIER